MKIICAPQWINLLSLGNKNISGIYLYYFILIRDSKDLNNKTLIHHEYIHHAQAKEISLVVFYFIYFSHFMFNLFKYKFNRHTAYKNICFEKEAYQYESDLNYLNNRKKFAWMKK
jgi:hypothetical protein